MTVIQTCLLALAGLLAMDAAGAPDAARAAHEHAMHAAPEPATMSGEEVVLPFLHYGNRPQVEVLLNGKGPYRFILDTGAQGSVIGKALMEELRLPVIGEVRIGSPAGTDPVFGPVVRIESASVGGIALSLKEAAVMDLAGYLKDAEGPKGVLSARLFGGLLLSFDYPNDQIRIGPGHLAEADNAEIFEYDSDDRLPTIPLTVAGVEVQTHLDTGSPGGFLLPGSYAGRLPLDSAPKEVGRARLVDREMTILAATLNGNVSVGKHVFERPEIRFAEGFPVANVGHRILKDFVVTLDFDNRRIRLERFAPPSAGG